MKPDLKEVWEKLLKLYAEADKLWAEGNKLYTEGGLLWAEGNKLHAEGDKLYGEARRLWAEAVIHVHGTIPVFWLQRPNSRCACKLETGEVFEPVSRKKRRKNE